MLDTKVRIFSGLSLSHQEAISIIPNLEFHPPIERGDIEACINESVDFVLIVDGVFQQSSAVSPGEITDALSRGICVFGSSSMGAMRAVELEDFGMKGFGKIFEFIRNTEVFRDDFLGQSFSAENLQTYSFPYLDIYLGCDQLELEGRLSRSEKELILGVYANLHFSNRCVAALYESLRDKPKLLELIKRIPENIQSTKKQDAQEMLSYTKEYIQNLNSWNTEKFLKLESYLK